MKGLGYRSHNLQPRRLWSGHQTSRQHSKDEQGHPGAGSVAGGTVCPHPQQGHPGVAEHLPDRAPPHPLNALQAGFTF